MSKNNPEIMWPLPLETASGDAWQNPTSLAKKGMMYWLIKPVNRQVWNCLQQYAERKEKRNPIADGCP